MERYLYWFYNPHTGEPVDDLSLGYLKRVVGVERPRFKTLKDMTPLLEAYETARADAGLQPGKDVYRQTL